MVDERITPGMAHAIARHGVRTIHPCGMPVPTYPGRYPSRCPLCNEPLVPVDSSAETPTAGEDDDS
jgi:hypothetical protein